MRTAVIIMSRVPRPGKTKTRLMTRMNGQECADFHRAALRDICQTVRESGLDGYIYYANDQLDISEKQEFCLSDSLWSLSDNDNRLVVLRPQRGSNLGERMKNAARELLPKYDAVVLIGSDSPAVSPAHFQQMLTMLSGYDLILGPAVDGGYYLLGMKMVYDDIFTGIPWGTAGVLKLTLAAADGLNLSYALLEPLADIDTWQDLLDFVQTGLANAASYGQLESFRYARYLAEKYAEDEEETKQ